MKRSVYTLLTILTLLPAAGCYHDDAWFRKGSPLKEKPAAAELDVRLVFVGDAGKAALGDPVMNEMERVARLDAEKTIIIFLGDNIYDDGLYNKSHPKYKKAAAILHAQAETASRTGARVYFIPGNHDWDNSGANGLQYVLNQQKFVDRYPMTRFLPRNGCPDVESRPAGSHVQLVFIDSQRLIHYFKSEDQKQIIPCRVQTKDAFVAEYSEAVKNARNEKRRTILLAHHPVKSEGPHGGFFDYRFHIFPVYSKNKYLPVPVLASLVVWSRQLGWATSTDISHSSYQSFIDVISQHSKDMFLMAAGHDHNLQLFDGDRQFQYYMVSGSGSKLSTVGSTDATIYAQNKRGFMVLDVTAGRTFDLKAHVIEEKGPVQYRLVDGSL